MAVANPSVEIVPLLSGTVKVRVVLPVTPEQSKATCFVLSELFLTLKPLSLVTTAVEVTEASPVNVVAELPRAMAVLPIVTALFARFALAIELPVDNTVPVSAGSVSVTSAVAAGPIKVTEFVPLSVSSLNRIFPAEVEDPFKVGPSIKGVVSSLFVKVSDPAVVAKVPSVQAVLNSANVPETVLLPNAIVLLVRVVLLEAVTVISEVKATVPVTLGSVIVLSEPVALAAVKDISYPSAFDPSKVILPLASDIELAPSTVPETSVVEAKEVRPAIVEAVPPKETELLPIVRELFAS